MNKNDKTELILNGEIFKALLTLSIPIIINNLIQTLYNLVDGIWVSKISSVHFAATSFVWPINFFVYFLRYWNFNSWNLIVIPISRS